MNKTIRLLGLTVLLVMVGCSLHDETPNDETITTSNKSAAHVKELPLKNKLAYRGTVKYFNLEGGFFGIVTDKGEKFLPQGLALEYQQDGAVIEFSGEIIKGMMTIQQWGTPFTISELKLIKPGKEPKTGDIDI